MLLLKGVDISKYEATGEEEIISLDVLIYYLDEKLNTGDEFGDCGCGDESCDCGDDCHCDHDHEHSCGCGHCHE